MGKRIAASCCDYLYFMFILAAEFVFYNFYERASDCRITGIYLSADVSLIKSVGFSNRNNESVQRLLSK